eukprot:4882609-Alexandrium_andersonii.AAC.1
MVRAGSAVQTPRGRRIAKESTGPFIGIKSLQAGSKPVPPWGVRLAAAQWPKPGGQVSGSPLAQTGGVRLAAAHWPKPGG